MADVLTPQQRHRCMSNIHSTSTKPEMKLRKGLWCKGYRYRKNDKRLPGTPDIVLPKFRTAIFIHGCFWHGHKGCRRYVIPKTNTEFWVNKISRNQDRDEEVWRALEAKGWFVIIVWECELMETIFDKTLSSVERALIANGKQYHRQIEDRRLIRQQHLLERAELRNKYKLSMAKSRR